MGFFEELKELGKAINEALTPKTIVDHVQERINELEKEMQSGRRFVSIRKIWNWMKENEEMRLLNYKRLNERLNEQLKEIEEKAGAKDNMDLQGREFEDAEKTEAVSEADEKDAPSADAGLAESAKTLEAAAENLENASAILRRFKETREPVEKDARYFGEAFLVDHYERMPEVNSVVLVRRETDGVWLASTVEEADAEARKVRCGSEWHSEFVPYRFNEELVGTSGKPKNPRELNWGIKVWVKDDLKDKAEEAVFIGFNPNGESDLRWMTLCSAESCLRAFADEKWPPFGHWKYMRLAED